MKRSRRILARHACPRTPHNRLQRFHRRRLPHMRLGRIRLPKPHPAIIRQVRRPHRRHNFAHPSLPQTAVHLRESDPRKRCRSPRKTSVHNLFVQPQDVEKPRPAVAIHHRDAHLRHHLRDPGVERKHHLRLAVDTFRLSLLPFKTPRRLQRQPRTHRPCAIPDQHRSVMDVATISSLDQQPAHRPQTRRNQSLMHRAGSHGHRNRKHFRARTPVGQHH